MLSEFFRAELRRRMKLRDLSARKLSRKAGLGESSIKEILAGRSQHPRSDTMAKIAKALGSSVAELTVPPQPQRVGSELVLSDEERSLVLKYRALTDEGRIAVMTMADAMPKAVRPLSAAS
jgi:transcriptional regulator with XRE-family HTH domain